MRPTIKKRRGFTLIELMVAMAVMVILMAIALPSMRAWLIQHQRGAAASEIFALLNQARSMAISNSQSALVTITTVAAPPGGNIVVVIPPPPAVPVIWTRTLNFGTGSYWSIGLVAPPAAGTSFTITPRGTVIPNGFVMPLTLTFQDQNAGVATARVGVLGDVTTAVVQ